jgi:hypothetical protein
MHGELEKPGWIVGAAVAGAALLATVIAVVALWQYVEFQLKDEEARKVATRPSPQLEALRAEEAARLSRYQWVDRKAGIVRIPVERALELTLRDRGRR